MSIDTVSDLPPRVQYVAAAAQTDFDYTFPIFDDADLEVIVDGVDQALNTDYTVSGAGDDTGGTITFAVGMDGDEIVTIRRVSVIERDTDIAQNGPWSSATYNDEQDKIFLILQELKANFQRCLRIPVDAEVDDDDIELTVANYANMYLSFDEDGRPTPAALSATTMTQDTIGQLLYPRTAAEVAAGVTPTDYAYPPGDVRRYGAVGDGVADDTSAIQTAINIGQTVYFYSGTYLCSNLTQSTNFQRLYGIGAVVLKKNANGAHFTSSGSNVELNGIGFRGDAGAPTFTGDGIVMSGDHPRLINCGSRWCPGRPVKLTGNHAQILGTCDIYQTTDATATGYDIEIGVSGTATLYHHVQNIFTSQATGGILLTDTGSAVVGGSQFGKIKVAAGTLPGGVNGGNFFGNRILGNIDVNISSAVFAGNTVGAVTVTFASGTSGHRFDTSNALEVGATLVDQSNQSIVEDSRLAPFQSYTPTFTAAGGSPAVGDGSLVGYYSKVGRRVKGFITFTIGSTTNLGSGVWYFSLPAVPVTSGLQCLGSCMAIDNGTTNYTGVSVALSDGTARIQAQIHNTANRAGAAIPHAWAATDSLRIEFDYFTD